MPATNITEPLIRKIRRIISNTIRANSIVCDTLTVGGVSIPQAGSSDTVGTLSVDYDVTSAGGKVLEVTAPESGLYVAELAIGGVWSFGDGTFDGIIKGKVVGDIVGESDQTDFTTNFRTFANVSGIPFYERSHATQPYATNIDFFWRHDLRQNNNYAGTVVGSHQWMQIYLEAGGKVELYLKDDNTNGIASGGYYRVLAGSKIRLRKVADFVYP